MLSAQHCYLICVIKKKFIPAACQYALKFTLRDERCHIYTDDFLMWWKQQQILGAKRGKSLQETKEKDKSVQLFILASLLSECRIERLFIFLIWSTGHCLVASLSVSEVLKFIQEGMVAGCEEVTSCKLQWLKVGQGVRNVRGK